MGADTVKRLLKGSSNDATSLATSLSLLSLNGEQSDQYFAPKKRVLATPLYFFIAS